MESSTGILVGQRLRNALGFLLTVRYQYDDPLDRQRASTLLLLSLMVGVFGLLGCLGLKILFADQFKWSNVIASLILSIFYPIVFWMVQKGYVRVAGPLYILVLLADVVAQFMPYDLAERYGFALFLLLPITIAASLLRPAWTYVVTALVAACLNFLVYHGGLAPSVFAVASSLALFLLAALIVSLTGQLERWAHSAQRRARQLEAAAVISEAAAKAPNLNALLNLVVERIRSAYGFYHAQVFLLDQEKRLARLQASTGRAGEALLARGHALPVGSRSVIGQCTYSGQPVVVNDTQQSSIWRPNELLPHTRAELALPLLIGNEVIGALDVQSTEPNAFQPEDIRSLQIMAAQLATTVEKTRLVDELQARVRENQRLLEETQNSLLQVEELSRRLTREGWHDYLRARRIPGALGYTLQGERIQRDTSWTAPMRQAFQNEQSVVIRHDQQAHIAALPLRVRGEVIGVLEIERGGDQPWTEAELEMAETLVDRLALAVENARLYEQAARSAEREQILNRIAQDVQEAETIDEVLQTALAELSQVLGATRGIVQISAKPEPTVAGDAA